MTSPVYRLALAEQDLLDHFEHLLEVEGLDGLERFEGFQGVRGVAVAGVHGSSLHSPNEAARRSFMA